MSGRERETFKRVVSDKLKFGIVLESIEIPAWKYQLIEDLFAERFVSVDLVLLDDAREAVPRPWLTEMFLHWIGRTDQGRGRKTKDACEIVSARELLRNVDMLQAEEWTTTQTGALRSVLDHRIERYALDVIVVLGDVQNSESLSELAKHGAWAFSHESEISPSVDCMSVALRQFLEGQPFIKSSLHIYHPTSSTGFVAYESYSPVDRKSLVRSRNWHLWKLSTFVTRVLRHLQRDGSVKFFRDLKPLPSSTIPMKASQHKRRGRKILLVSFVRYNFSRLLHKLLNIFRKEKWQLMFAVGAETNQLSKFKLLRSPDGTFWADPFAVRHNNGFAILFEEASIASGHGHLSVMQMSGDGSVQSVSTVLSRPYHLSYPFIFEWDGQKYLVPESAENRTISLYRFTRFPDRVEFVYNLMEDVCAFDATLVEHMGRWWMFANVKSHDGASDWDELCLFYADTPISRFWRAHRMNPVVSDVRSARPAGRLFVKDGDLYRPSQDSSYRYGYGLNIARVIEMTTTRYREEIVKRIHPNWSRKVSGVHSWTQCDELTMIDAIYRMPRRIRRR